MVSLNKYEGILSKENAMQCFNKLWNKISFIALYHNLIFYNDKYRYGLSTSTMNKRVENIFIKKCPSVLFKGTTLLVDL